MQLTMTSIPVTVHDLSPHHGSLITAIICKGEDSKNQFRSDADQPDKSPAPIFNPAARVILSLLASDWSRWDPLSGGFPAPIPSFQKTTSAIR